MMGGALEGAFNKLIVDSMLLLNCQVGNCSSENLAQSSVPRTCSMLPAW